MTENKILIPRKCTKTSCSLDFLEKMIIYFIDTETQRKKLNYSKIYRFFSPYEVSTLNLERCQYCVNPDCVCNV